MILKKQIILSFLFVCCSILAFAQDPVKEEVPAAPETKEIPSKPKVFAPPPPPSQEDERYFVVVEEMPRFPGCEGDDVPESKRDECAKKLMLQYIYKRLSYPPEARGKQIEGTVVVQFVVQKDGSIGDIKIVKDIGAGCGLEAKRVIEQMNEDGLLWTPGIQRGRPVKVRYTLPMRFKIPKKQQKKQY